MIMVRAMYDSTRPGTIPADAAMVAGYSNGDFAWTPEDWARFPRSKHVRIDVLATDPEGSGVLDVERFDATPSAVPGWIRARLPHGRAVIYCDRDNLPAIRAAAGDLPYSVWLADPMDSPEEIPGAIAVQWRTINGYDESAVYDPTWHGR